MLNKFINAFRPSVMDVEGTGTYPDGVFAALAMRQVETDAGASLRSSYAQDYLLAKKSNEVPRAHS